jgi:hypothetical protein
MPNLSCSYVGTVTGFYSAVPRHERIIAGNIVDPESLATTFDSIGGLEAEKEEVSYETIYCKKMRKRRNHIRDLTIMFCCKTGCSQPILKFIMSHDCLCVQIR